MDYSLTEALLTAVLGYLIGSFPSAYLIARSRSGVDLRREGSGNIGSMNSFEVTGSKSVGLMTLVSDLLKGFLPTFVLSLYNDALLPILAIALVLGHCYPIYLRFHGGRGLATAAGVGLAMTYLITPLWIVLYFAARKIKDHVHFGNIAATAISTFVVLVIPSGTLEAMNGVTVDLAADQIRIGVLGMFLLILIRHLGPLRDLMDGKPDGLAKKVEVS